MSSTKKIIKNSAMMYCVMFLTIITGIYTSREILGTLGVDDFGIYSLIGGLIILFTFINASMAGAVQRFLSASLGNNDIETAKEYFNASIVVHITIALLILVVGKTLGEWILLNKLTISPERMNAAYLVYHAILIAFMIQVTSAPAQAMLTSYEKMGTLSLITFLNPLGRLTSIIIVKQIPNIDKLVMFSFFITCFSLLQNILFYTFAYFKCSSCRLKFTTDKKKYKQLTNFAGWGLFGDLAVLVKVQGTSILLNLFFGTMANASYGVSNQLVSNFRNLSAMITRASNPQIIMSYTSGNKKKAFKLVTQLSKISFSILFSITLPFLLQTNWLLTVWLKTVPQYAVNFVNLSIVVALIEISAMPLMTLSRATGKIKLYQMAVGGTVLTIFPAGYITFLFSNKPEAVFVVMAIITLLAFFIRLIVLRKTSGIHIRQYLKATVIKALALIILVWGTIIFPLELLVNDIIIKRLIHILVLPLTTCFLSYFIMLTKHEQKSVIHLFRKNR